MRGQERFSAPGKASSLIVRLSAGDREIPELKPFLRLNTLPLD
jgi:hypothetical protein